MLFRPWEGALVHPERLPRGTPSISRPLPSLPGGNMLKRSWIFLLPLVASLLWAGSAPSQATSASWSFAGVNSTGCANDTWDIAVTFEGVSTVQHQFHTVVSSGGLVYMNQGFDDTFPDGNDTWGLYSSSTYGPTTGTYPIPSGQPMKVRLILERPKGTVVSSWTFVAESCDSGVLTFNAADFDNDMVADAVDKCPHLKSSRANGCPLRSRTLTLNDKYGPKRVVGKLYAPGYPLLYVGRT